jgi:hypothetical protein
MNSFKRIFIVLIAVMSITSAYAQDQVSRKCRPEALAAVHEAYEGLFRNSDFLPIVRVFSSQVSGSNITHYVMVNFNGSREMMTVELNSANCRVLRVE